MLYGINSKTNEVIVGEEQELYSNILYANQINWIIEPKEKMISCYAKIRYRSKEATAIVIKEKDKVKVEFKKPQRAITSGQSVVFYDEDGIVLGGGIIQ